MLQPLRTSSGAISLEDGKQVGLRLRGRDSGAQTDCGGGAVLAPGGVGGGELPRCPECKALVVEEVFRHDSDDGVRGCVQEQGLAEHAAVARKAAFPELMGEDHDAGRAWVKLLVAEGAAERRRAGEHAETVARHFAAVLVGGTLGTGEGHVLPVRQADVLEGLHALAKDLCVGGRDAGRLALGIDLVQAVEAIGIRVGQGTQQYGIHDAKYRAVGADAEGQNGDHNGDEARRAAERARAESQVLQESGHRHPIIWLHGGQRMSELRSDWQAEAPAPLSFSDWGNEANSIGEGELRLSM